CDDLVWFFGPAERAWVLVGLGEKPFDRPFEFFHGAEHTTCQSPVRQFGEEALDSVEPGCRCWREMEGPPRVRQQPFAHLRMLVGRIVVDDRMDMLAGRPRGVDRVEET